MDTKKHEKRVVHIKKGYNIWKISAIAFFVLFVASLLTGGFSISKADELPEKKAADTAVNFINKNLMQGQAVAVSDSIREMKDQNCLYNLTLSINGKKFESYITKDASYLFPQAINMKEPIPQQPDQQQPADTPKTAKPEVLLFTMSYCPYGNQAEEGIGPVVKALGNDVEIQPHYVIYANYRGGGPDLCLDAENKYCSMHGINELNEDVRELCIYKYEKAKYWDYVLDVNNKCNVGNIEECWEGVAKSKGIDTERAKTCQKNEALTLLAKEVELNSKYEVSGSPMLFINGAQYQGARTPDAYKAGICSGFNTPPGSCSAQLSTQGAAAAGECG